jgi:hypothetical protein
MQNLTIVRYVYGRDRHGSERGHPRCLAVANSTEVHLIIWPLWLSKVDLQYFVHITIVLRGGI